MQTNGPGIARAILIGFLLTIALQSCGQKGPLYLPEPIPETEDAEEQKAPTQGG